MKRFPRVSQTWCVFEYYSLGDSETNLYIYIYIDQCHDEKDVLSVVLMVFDIVIGIHSHILHTGIKYEF